MEIVAMTDPWGDHFSEAERALLEPFVTDVDTPIFGLRNLPEVVKGALFSRYSRTDKSLRRILLDEFISASESGFAAIVGDQARDQLVATQQAEAFYERVLIGYGDDSVAELGGAHLACEGVSNIAAKALEDSRIGISPLEKSTRYVRFDRKVNGQYRYLREPQIMASRFAAQYEAALDGLFDTYAALLEPCIAYLSERNPRDQQTSERAYTSAIRAKAFDLLRGLLPMATLTNVGLFGNGRSFEYLLNKLGASPLVELQQLNQALQAPLDQMIPSFVKRAKNERGKALQAYLRGLRERAAQAAQDLPSPSSGEQADVVLVNYDADAELKVVAALLYPHAALPLAELQSLAAEMSAEERASIIREYVGERANRFQRPGRAFEEANYSFDLLADIGAYRDLQRHRVLTQDRQRFGVHLGYLVPAELEQAGLAEQYCAAIERAAELVRALEAEYPEQSQYAVPMAFRVRWRFSLNLRELYHLAELRSAPQGHPSYRRVAQEMYRCAQAVHPSLTEAMRFVDMADYDLERLDAERRLDAKIARVQQKTV
jgi:thymidylate synthase ThyX